MGWADVIISTIITSYKAHQRTECELLWVNDREHSLMLKTWHLLCFSGSFNAESKG